MFEEALDVAHETVLRNLERLWIRYIDHASNYGINGLSPEIARSVSKVQSLRDSMLASLDAGSMDELDVVRPSSRHRVMGTNREFWVNTKTSISQVRLFFYVLCAVLKPVFQWSRPYFPRIFRCQEIEVDTFIQILIRKDVFPKRYDEIILWISWFLFILLFSLVLCWSI
jgi:hypothetical protein